MNDLLNTDEILPGLYLGSKHSANPNFITENNIQLVIQLLDDYEKNPPQLSKLCKLLRYNIPDDPRGVSKMFDILPVLVEIIDEALKRKYKILVHCAAGISRSVTVVTAYLILKKGMPLNNALKFVQSQRKIAQPKEHFMEKVLKKL